MPGTLELCTQLTEVVEFTVVNEHCRACLAGHRLVTARRHVYDGEPAASQPHWAIHVDPPVIGAAMTDDVGHPGEDVGRCGLAVQMTDAHDATHGLLDPERNHSGETAAMGDRRDSNRFDAAPGDCGPPSVHRQRSLTAAITRSWVASSISGYSGRVRVRRSASKAFGQSDSFREYFQR